MNISINHLSKLIGEWFLLLLQFKVDFSGIGAIFVIKKPGHQLLQIGTALI